MDAHFRAGDFTTVRQTNSQATNDSGFGSPRLGSGDFKLSGQTSSGEMRYRSTDTDIKNPIENSKVKRVADTRFPSGDFTVKIRPFSDHANSNLDQLIEDDNNGF